MNSKYLEPSESQLTYGYHVVVFLDLIGQKKHLATIENIIPVLSMNEESERLKQTLRETVGTIRAFRSAFENFFDAFNNREQPDFIPEEFKEQFERLREHSDVTFQGFSDSQIIWTPISRDLEFGFVKSLNSIQAMLYSLVALFPLFLSKGVPFRGGIDIEGGILLYPDKKELYGPVLNRAYQLESKVADYPRVAVGKGLIQFLESLKNATFENKIAERYCKVMVNECYNWIVKDEDGQYIIHFLSPAAIEIYEPELKEQLREHRFVSELENFIAESLVEFKDYPKLKNRYLRLKAYIDKYKEPWRALEHSINEVETVGDRN